MNNECLRYHGYLPNFTTIKEATSEIDGRTNGAMGMEVMGTIGVGQDSLESHCWGDQGFIRL